MNNIKYVKNSKYLILSILLLVFSAIVLIVNALGTSLAWFTDTDSVGFEGNAATVDLQLYRAGVGIDSSDDISLSASSSDAITVRNTGSISVYLRVLITCNWQNTSADYGNIFNYVTFGVSSSEWYIPTNAIQNGGFIYYKGAIASNATKTILSSITISSIPAGAGNVIVNVWAESVQANDDGLEKILPSGTTLSAFKTALGLSA